jgi:hypothetical protein
VVQGFPQLKGVHKGLARPVFPVQFEKAFAPDFEGHDPFAIPFDPQVQKISSLAQEKRPPEDVRGFKMLQNITSLQKNGCRSLCSKTCQVKKYLF